MEAESFHITNDAHVDNAPLEVATPSRGGAERRVHEERRQVTPVRLGLQRRAHSNLRRHFLRAFRRFVVLVVADLASFYVMRELVRAVRDSAVLGEFLAAQMHRFLPAGILNGWQYAVALFAGLVILGNYGPGDERRNPRRLFWASALATALPLWMTLWTRGLEVVAVQYALTTTLVWLGLVSERKLLDLVVARVQPHPIDRLRTLFVGPSEACRETSDSAAFTADSEYRPIGFVDTHIPPADEALGHIVDFAAVLQETGAEAVVVCGYLTDARFHDIVDAALTAGSKVLAVPRTVQIVGVEPQLVWRRDQPLVELTAPTLRGGQLLIKRVVDFVGAGLLVLVSSPLMLAIAALIKLDSKGSVFFGQERIGTGGKRFRVWKFRTMRSGASDAPHRELVLSMMAGNEQTTAATDSQGKRVFKLISDSRVTRFGKVLRRLSLDELPQLFNVLAGQMSLVGPRPPLPYEFEAYDHWQFDRLGALPGITGLWQVSGRNLLSYRQMCELDVEYVRKWSLWLDIKILFRTIPVVFFNSGRAA